jgi:hypothetical protein
MDFARELYDAFQRFELERWDAIIADDVLINSRVGRDIKGLKTLKELAARFTDLGDCIDLIDGRLALDHQGNGRGFISFLFNSNCRKDFGRPAPTASDGTSEETMLLTIRNHKIVRIDDLAIYEWERG